MEAQPVVRAAVVTHDVAGWVRRYWQDTIMAVHAQRYDVAALPALIALADELIVGVLSYLVQADALEIVLCHTQPPGQGVGRALVNAAVELAGQQSLRRVWCTTTNDNLAALGFWQAVGFALVALRPGAVTLARQLKPTIPVCGYRGLPIRDELDLELQLPRLSATQ